MRAFQAVGEPEAPEKAMPGIPGDEIRVSAAFRFLCGYAGAYLL